MSIAIWIAVLAFGGTSPPFFLVTQVLILGLAILFLSLNLPAAITTGRFPFVCPLLLIGLVVLQILPLPAFLTRWLGYGTDRTISFAPYQTASSLILLVTYLTAFYLVLLLCEDRNAKQRLVYSLLALGVFEAFYGLTQYLTGWQQIFGYVKKYYLEDATGTYINRNHFAGLLEMVLPFSAALALRSGAVLRRAAGSSGPRGRRLLSAAELPSLVFWLFLAITIFIALLYSRSRMGLISAVASLIVVLALAGSSSLSKHTRAAAAVMFFLGAIGIALWVGTDPLITRFETLGHEFSQTGQNRISIWRDTLKLICQHPFLGTGLGTFAVAFTSVQSTFLTSLVDHAHCDYLEVSSELGLPGAILLFGSIAYVFARALRSYRYVQDSFEGIICLGCGGGITAILLHGLADFNLYIPANALVFTILLALAWKGSSSPEPAKTDRRGPGRSP